MTCIVIVCEWIVCGDICGVLCLLEENDILKKKYNNKIRSIAIYLYQALLFVYNKITFSTFV